MPDLSDDLKETAPAEAGFDTLLRWSVRIRVNILTKICRIVDHEGLSADVQLIDKPPESAVVAEIPIIPHDEEVSVRDRLRLHEVTPRLKAPIPVECMFLSDPISVDVHGLFFDRDRIATHRYNPFNEIFRSVFGIDKHDHITAGRGCKLGESFIGKRYTDAVDELAYKDMIADEQRRLHGS